MTAGNRGFADAGIGQLLAGFASREFSPVEVAQDALDRAEQAADLNAFITIDHEGAMAAARQAERVWNKGRPGRGQGLVGVPISVKDLLLTKNLRTTRGSLLERDTVPSVDAPSVSRLRAAGAVIFAKTNTCQAGWKGDAGNRLMGSSVNPWDHSLSAGGSSGGAGVAAALGIGPVAIGTDGAGSVRIPAAYCGVVGFKPSFGRIPYWPASPEGLSHVGTLSRSVADAARVVEVMSGPSSLDPQSLAETNVVLDRYSGRKLTIGFTTTLGFARAESFSAEACVAAARQLSAAGHRVIELNLALDDPYDILDVIWAGHEAASFAGRLDEVADLLDPGYERLIRRGLKMTAQQLALAHEGRAAFTAQLLEQLEGIDVLLTPTMPGEPFELGLSGPLGPNGQAGDGLTWTPFTYPFNLSGLPAISVPYCLSPHGVPIGVQVVGGWRNDSVAVEVARQVEQGRGWEPDYPTAGDATSTSAKRKAHV